MNTRICAASSDDADRCHRDFRERFFQLLLHRRLAKLPLPPAVSNAAILKPERPAPQRLLRWLGGGYRTINAGLSILTAEFGEYRFSFGLLRFIPIVNHFAQDFARAFTVSHFFIGAGKVEFGRGVMPLTVKD